MDWAEPAYGGGLWAGAGTVPAWRGPGGGSAGYPGRGDRGEDQSGSGHGRGDGTGGAHLPGDPVKPYPGNDRRAPGARGKPGAQRSNPVGARQSGPAGRVGPGDRRTRQCRRTPDANKGSLPQGSSVQARVVECHAFLQSGRSRSEGRTGPVELYESESAVRRRHYGEEGRTGRIGFSRPTASSNRESRSASPRSHRRGG